MLFRERLKIIKYEDVESGKDKYFGDFFFVEYNIKVFIVWFEWIEC